MQMSSLTFEDGHRFDWPRYWRVLPTGSNAFQPTDDSHFLPDPAETAKAWASLGLDAPAPGDAEPSPLAKLIENKSAIVMLGRPGAGKTAELEGALKSGLLDHDGHPPILRRGKTLLANQSPHDFIFDRDDWRETRSRAVTLVLDGLDEVMQISPRFVGAFQEALESELSKRGGHGSIRLVLTCRSAEWRARGLLQAWPKERQIEVSLCQLTSEAATRYVRHQLGSSADGFWEEASRLRLNALVVWPHSLVELVQQFKGVGHLPSSHFDLIRGASLRRCRHSTSWDEDRARRSGKEEDPKWVFRLVGRVAAVGVFGGQAAVSTEGWEFEGAEPWTNSTEREIKTSELESLGHYGHFDVTEDKRLVFQHQIFREHMAAAWLAERGLTVHQLKRLFGQSREEGWVHYPQLATVAAWLAADPSQTAWREFLIQRDPMVLLRADATNLGDSEKEKIAKALLERALRDGHTDPGQAHQSLDTLACDGLAAIVEPFLDDTSLRASAARELAIEIVHDAKIESLVPKLWAFARSEQETARVPIARALRDLAGNEYLKEWEEVLAERIPSDEHGTLLGAALEFLIPAHKGVRDALHVLLPPRDIHIFGEITFSGVLHRLHAKVQDEDIIPIIERSARNHAIGFGRRVSDRETILSAAFRRLASHLDEPLYMEALADWWVERCYSHANGPEWRRATDSSSVTLDDLGMREQSRRRRFLLAFAEQSCRNVTDGRKGTHMAMDVGGFVVIPDDVPWLIQNVKTRAAKETHFWCWFLVDAVKKTGLRPSLQLAWDEFPQLRERFSELPPGVSVFDYLSSKWKESENKQKREGAVLRRRIAKQQEERAELIHDRRKAAETATAKGDPKAWPLLVHTRDGAIELDSVDEVKTGPEWMKEAARLYLRSEPPHYPGPPDVHTNISLRIHSNWAFYVLWEEMKVRATVPHDSLLKWMPYIFSNMASGGWETEGFQIKDVLAAFAPDSVDVFLKILGHDYQNQGGMYSVRHLESFWSDHTRAGMVALLKEVAPQPQGFCNGLEFLARYDLASAKHVANHWLERVTLSADDDAGRTLMAGMITALNGYGWDKIKSVLNQSHEAARKILVHAFGRLDLDDEEESRLASFADDHLGELVEIFFQTFPPAEDPKREDGSVTTEDKTRFARNALFGLVQERGLVSVVRRLRALQLSKTERWFGYAMARAKASKNSADWKPLTPDELFSLARQHDLALVRSDDELLDAVELAVRRYGDLVRTSRLSDIWVRSSNATQPEPHISECLRTWLDDQWRVTLPREAETPRGKKTDIEIPLNRLGRHPFHVTVEVKKSTRDNVLDGMETQLRDDYLVARGHTHGLYLVFWVGGRISGNGFVFSSAGELEEYLEQQATALSQGSLRIKAVVIDCNLPVGTGSKRRSKRKARE
jgi:hypothetical protein